MMMTPLPSYVLSLRTPGLLLVLVSCLVLPAMTMTIPPTTPDEVTSGFSLVAMSTTTASNNPPAASTPTSPTTTTCVLSNGTLIQATQDNPVHMNDDVGDLFACVKCYCVSDEYYNEYFYGDGDIGDRFSDFGEPEPADYREALCLYLHCFTPRCVDMVRTTEECCPVCPNGKNCYKPQNRTCRNKMKRARRNRKNKNKNNKKICPRETMPAGEDIVIGRKVCRCDEADPYLEEEEYNTEAVCEQV